jgi:hypothetical protein
LQYELSGRSDTKAKMETDNCFCNFPPDIGTAPCDLTYEGKGKGGRRIIRRGRRKSWRR